jgi:hypothetical protein
MERCDSNQQTQQLQGCVCKLIGKLKPQIMELAVNKTFTESEERRLSMLESLSNTISNAIWMARNTDNSASAQISLCEGLIKTFPCASKEEKLPG